MKEKETIKNKYNISDDEDYLSSVSCGDCTGLIPANASTPEMLEIYKEIYPFGAPDVGSTKEENQPPCK